MGEIRQETREEKKAMEEDAIAGITADSPPSEEEVEKELEAIDLTSVGAGLGQGRILPANDIVEELAMIPSIPHQELTALEKAWRSGEKDSLLVFEQLQEWHDKHVLPSGWLQGGVNQIEKEEMK